MKNEFHLRVANESDKNQIISLLNNVFDEQERSVSNRGDEWWQWKFKESPFGESFITVVEYDHKIVGFANMWPWEFNCRGNIIKTLQPCDSAIHSDFRGQGLFKKTRIFGVEYARNMGYQFIFNFPNNNSFPAYESLGWYYLGRINWWVKIIKPISTIKGKFSESKTTPFKINDEYKIDLSILDIIANESVNFDGFIKINRIPGFHKWRYVNHPNRNYGMIVVSNNNKNTALIFTINQKGNNREMVVVDIIGSKVHLHTIFKKLNIVAKDLNVDFIAVIENSSYNMYQLWRLGYLRKKMKNMVVLPLNIQYEPIVTLFSNWSLMASMHDSI